LWTAHLVHVSPLHWLSNLLALLVLRCWFGPGFWRLALRYWLLAAPVLSWLLLLVRPDLAWYAGASGLLWCLAMVVMLMRSLHQAWPRLLLVSTLLWLEMQRHGVALVGGAEAVPEAHLLGALLGLLAVAAGRFQLLWALGWKRYGFCGKIGGPAQAGVLKQGEDPQDEVIEPPGRLAAGYCTGRSARGRSG
jgi:hypothetical protein